MQWQYLYDRPAIGLTAQLELVSGRPDAGYGSAFGKTHRSGAGQPDRQG
jgi:hypothetical protein